MGLVPATRWTRELTDDVSTLNATQLKCVRHGGWVEGAQRFDSRAFGISPAEASTMDPQQRLLVELGYAALHASSQRRGTLMGGGSGVFVGIERPDCRHRASVSAHVTDDNLSVAAGRLW